MASGSSDAPGRRYRRRPRGSGGNGSLRLAQPSSASPAPPPAASSAAASAPRVRLDRRRRRRLRAASRGRACALVSRCRRRRCVRHRRIGDHLARRLTGDPAASTRRAPARTFCGSVGVPSLMRSPTGAGAFGSGRMLRSRAGVRRQGDGCDGVSLGRRVESFARARSLHRWRREARRHRHAVHQLHRLHEAMLQGTIMGSIVSDSV